MTAAKNPSDDETTGKPFVISRVLNAPRELVWKAWTERDRLAQWFGPKGVTITTASLDFRPGGIFHYCMKTPDGKDMWGKFTYRKITPPERIEWVNSFSDPSGGITRHPMAPAWPAEMLSVATFEDQGGKTKLSIHWSPLNATAEEVAFFNGMHSSMNQGWTGTFEQLEAYLATAKS
jgi:uncharacterized protein YndB with AHSA1/START domain